MEELKYSIRNVATFPYDWRATDRWAAEDCPRLVHFVEWYWKANGEKPVTLIGLSMGGSFMAACLAYARQQGRGGWGGVGFILSAAFCRSTSGRGRRVSTRASLCSRGRVSGTSRARCPLHPGTGTIPRFRCSHSCTRFFPFPPPAVPQRRYERLAATFHPPVNYYMILHQAPISRRCSGICTS